MRVVRELDHPARTVLGVDVFVRQTMWADGQSSYGLYLAPAPDGVDLTEHRDTGEYDHMPSDAEIAAFLMVVLRGFGWEVRWET